MLRLAWVVSQFPAQYLGKLLGFNLWKLITQLPGVFLPFVRHFLSGCVCHVVYEVWLVRYLFFSFQAWYFLKWIITSVGQRKHKHVSTPYEFLIVINRMIKFDCRKWSNKIELTKKKIAIGMQSNLRFPKYWQNMHGIIRIETCQ